MRTATRQQRKHRADISLIKGFVALRTLVVGEGLPSQQQNHQHHSQ
jgi:hypothetical protein